VTGKLNLAGASRALDAATGRATVTSRTTYLALLTTVPTPNVTLSTMAEYGAAGYARQPMAMSAPSGSPMQTSNTALLTYGPLTGATGGTSIVGWAEVSALSGTTGEVVAQGDFGTARTPVAGASLTVPIGGIVVQID
jgi:hypothetical protein